MDTAIIGISCRLPDADNYQSFWENLVANKSAISEIPKERWDWSAYWGDPKEKKNKSCSKWGGFVNDVDAFDNDFFELLPKVVKTMDPQQRIMLELAWACFEDAGIPPSRVANKKIGVIFGVFNHDYKELQESSDRSIEAHYSTGTAASIVTNRVSHFFSLHGPSIPIDTACSSSLNAIHSAIQAMELGDCEMTLAGGINLLFTPTRHISFSKMGMLSPTGTCKTFDSSADGYVRSEGAGIVLLKPLDKAVADGDAIYGIIKGSAVNHCGKTYTLTYPSAQAQSEVIAEAIDRAQVPIDSITYIETHGTGTPKGDPIEFEGLVKAFDTVSQKQQIETKPGFCALGAVKTNIGHLEAAAGIAGVIKVLMALNNKKLPALHHYKELNPGINNDNTPFHLLDSIRDWERPADRSGNGHYPLRAGVSSFGFGGTNAHVILEEAPQLEQVESSKVDPIAYLICLSAKTKEALERKRRDLAAWVKADKGTTSLLDISSTLLLGRDHFSWRYGFVVRNREQLLRVLELNDQDENAPKAMQIVNAGESDKEESPDLNDCVAFLATLKGDANVAENDYTTQLEKLCGLYLEGYDLEWSQLYSGYSLKRVHMPTYPFAKARFWIDLEEGDAGLSKSVLLHPLLHQNVSNLEKQFFYSRFTGKEFFLADHKVKGNPVLPGVAYLEMAVKALEISLATRADNEGSAICLRNIVWMRPMEVNSETFVLTNILPGQPNASFGNCLDGSVVDFEITSDDSAEEPAVIYCRGTAFKAIGKAAELSALPRSTDGSEYSTEECYTALQQLGLDYGDAHQAIDRFQVHNSQCEVRLKLPEKVKYSPHQYTLHPSMVDAAMQAAVLLVSGKNGDLPKDIGENTAPFLPFALNEICIDGSCAGEMTAWVRFSEGYDQYAYVKKVDIDLFNAITDAEPVIRLRGLHLRQLVSGAKDQPKQDQPKKEFTLLSEDNCEGFYAPTWIQEQTRVPAGANIQNVVVIGDESDLNGLVDNLKSSPLFAQTYFIKISYGDHYAKLSDRHYHVRPELLESNDAVLDDLKSAGVVVEYVLHIASNSAAHELNSELLDNGLNKGARGLFALTKSLLKRAKRVRLMSLVQGQKGDFKPLYQGLTGFYKTVKIEKPAFNGRVVLCDWQGGGAQQVAQRIFNELCSETTETDVIYQGDVRFIRCFVPAVQHEAELDAGTHGKEQLSYKVGGVYLITGGMGALGLIFAGYILEKYQGTVYLMGRSSLDEKKQAVLDEISSLGGTAKYIACDVSSADDVISAVQSIRDDDQWLNGVIHSAGVIEDSFILRKTPEAFERVVLPKTHGTLNLDMATKDHPLDFFVMFSSVTGVLGNLGQCDYGFGNSFEDYYSHYRNGLHATGERSGKALAVNWPYWRNGGMTLTDKEEQILQRNFGIIPLENDKGLHALEVGLKSSLSQLAVLEAADEAKVHQVLGVRGATNQSKIRHVAATASTATVTNVEKIKREAVKYLIDIFSKELTISQDRFELDSSFQQYGFDSVVMINLVNVLEKRFTGLPKTLFFEYQTLNDLGTFFAENYPDHFISQASTKSNSVSVGKKITPSQYGNPSTPRSRFLATTTRPGDYGQDKIAIIGVAGRYPEAETVAELWDNLKAGRDCIREIPSDRWSIEKMFQPGAATLGKSYSKWGGFIKDVDKFDPLFFNISPKEAEVMDPHERLFLETVANTIADAGYHPDYLAQADGVKENPVGVYVGVMWGDYQLHGVESEDPNAWTAPRSFYWAVANRVSYFFDFSGPSITIDTACSSSITAIHLACEAIKRGEIQTAIAGGVNLSVHPNKYNMLSNMQFLSSDGRCRSFGEGGDGYVPGEGVGAVVLKPLSAAVHDGDHIYGVIRGSALNHGGKTSGFTVPNPNRQVALIREALDTAGVNPRHVSYLEAHGTGTSLGDPIELTGLSKAYAQEDKQYCSIGSAKSNIGHLEAAAGIAGLTKVLMQMKYETIVPSLHSETLNPYIDFANSPFYVQQDLSEWKRPLIDDGHGRRELPRIAGISSFGAGGANAHLIVEEYLADESATQSRPKDNLDAPVLILLSAKREEPLRAMAAELLNHIQREHGLSLLDVAFTLQTGRVALDFRLAIVTGSFADLSEKLRAFIAGATQSTSGIYSGKQVNARTAVQASEQAIQSSLQNNALDELAALWIEGAKIDWQLLQGNNQCRRVPLPGYAYHKQRYWTEKPVSGKSVSALHPLIDSNISTLDEQVFQKQFNGNAFYLQDHQLGGAKVLPGVVHLEMAIQATKIATHGEQVKSLHDIVWSKPIIVDEVEQSARIGLAISDQGLGFEIYDLHNDQKTAYSNGRIELVEPEQEAGGYTTTVPLIDVKQIKARCARQEREAINRVYEAKGFNIGPSFKVFDYLYFNADEALAHLTLADELQNSMDQFVLHPALLDATLRTSIAIGGLDTESSGLPVPIRLHQINIYRPLSGSCFAYARRAVQKGLQPQQQSFDITVMSESGEVLLALMGLLTETLASPSIFASKRKVQKPASQPAVIRKSVSVKTSPVVDLPVTIPSAGANSEQARYDAVKFYLTKLISEATKIPADQIDPQATFDSYGIDSVMILRMNEKMAATFGDEVSKTLFFEYQNLDGLTEYFLENHADDIDTKLGASIERVSQVAQETVEIPATIEASVSGQADEQALYSSVQHYLAKLISDETKLPVDQIDVHDSFESYGIDSVMILKVNESLVNTFGSDVSKTLFFEYGNLHDLAEHFVENYPTEIQAKLLAPTSPVQREVATVVEEPSSDEEVKSKVQKYLLHVFSVNMTLRDIVLSVDSALDELELDPIEMVGIVHQLRQHFSKLPVNVICQYPSISLLAGYLMRSSRQDVAKVAELPEAQSRSMQEQVKEASSVEIEPRSKSTNSVVRKFSLHANRFSRLDGKAAGRQHEDIAIIGLSGRYPQANSLEAFWENLVQGRDCINEIPASRWDYRCYFNKDRNAKDSAYSKWGGFVDDIDQFDAQFFNISCREAEIIDPQIRNYLHAAWQCIEDAAYTRKSLRDKSVGVFVGIMWGHYQLLQVSEEQKQYGRPYVSYASIANRVSHFFDFHGPSLSMDTMCSSSLTAIHQACLSMRNGDCDVALVGGVNLQTHPVKYLLLSQGQFMSTDGRCRAFGKGGDGYVPGEGIGAAFLKPLSQAIKDGDHIYGVIKASAINHGGKTHGYTVPNQSAQTNVIGQALDKANWAPETVNYIEAHGTGTSLGDPIEVAGLTKAFEERAFKKGKDGVSQYCRIGSVKSNIGHLESAAGIAALTKVLLQMKHKTIAPSLHSAQLNPNINFGRTPFRVVQKAEAWEDKFDTHGKPVPRRAGISSFGAGGSNAHLLIEEYIPATQPESLWMTPSQKSNRVPGIFVLSADTQARLTLYVERMVAFLKQCQSTAASQTQEWFANLVYTSQVGRELMTERLAVVANNVDELLTALENYNSSDKPNNLYLGSVANQRDKFETILDEDAKNVMIQTMLNKQQFSQLARAWASYLGVDWSQYIAQLYPLVSQKGGNIGLQRISMPTMPFITQKYWVDEAKEAEGSTIQSLHPLIDSNQSTLSEQRYLKMFTGEEFYLKDHVIGLEDKQVILPGVAYLEMARVTGAMAMSDDFRVHRLCNVMWIQPIQVKNEPRPVYVHLEQQEDRVTFNVVSKLDSNVGALAENSLTHCQGEVYYLPTSLDQNDERLDIDALKANAIAVEHQAQIYQGFQHMGFWYGPGYQVTHTRYRMADAALCKLVLPEHLVNDFDSFYMHPSLMDAALRTCLGIGSPVNVSSVPIVPFALEEMEIRAPLTRECYAYAVHGNGQESALKKYHLVITDTDGKILVKLHNFAGRELIKSRGTENQIHYFDYRWQESPITEKAALGSSDTVLVISGDGEAGKQLARISEANVVNVQFGEKFAALGNVTYQINPDAKEDYSLLIQHLSDNALWPTHIVYALDNNGYNEYPVGSDIVSWDILTQSLRHGVHSIFFLFQALEQVNAGQPMRCVFAYRGQGGILYPQYDGLSGLAKSLLVTNHRFELMTLCLDDTVDSDGFAQLLVDELTACESVNGIEIKYQQGQRLRRHVTNFYPQSNSPLPTKEKGVYLITGGAGKLGLLFARYFAQTCQAKLILVGRSQLRNDQQKVIDALVEMGAEVIYRPLDVTDLDSVNTLIEEVKQKYGRVDGIVHSAGVADATPITELSKAEFDRILAPKLDGMLNLDIATRKDALDFFVCFSSVSALLGDLGAGSYAFANRFMDSFASIREQWRTEGKRQGVTVAINWPLWATGGMEIPEEKIAFFNFSGISALSEDEGLEAFETALRAGSSQLVVATGNLEKIRRTFKVSADQARDRQIVTELVSANVSTIQASISMVSEAATHNQFSEGNKPLSSRLLQITIDHIKGHLGAIIKTSQSDINPNATFESLGMDSVMLMEMQNSLKKDFDKLPKTVLFEYDSVTRLAEYLVANDADTLKQLFGSNVESNVPQADSAQVQSAPQAVASTQPKPMPAISALARTAIFSSPTSRTRSFVGSVQPAGREVRNDAGIAIIGLAGRFPKASNMDEFWENLQSGRNCIVTIPEDRWEADKWYSSEQRLRSNQACSKWGGFVDSVEQFDPDFFRMSQSEAERADPQLRLLLETAWQALEDSAYTPSSLADSTVGVYMGAMNDDFTWISSEIYTRTTEYIGPGMVASELANRLSFVFDFKGPSMTIQTACSSSFTAIHMARMAILGGECDMAIAGGVNLSLHHAKYLLLQEVKVLSPDGQERTFDDGANGLVPSEGAGVVVMKRLSKALEDGDHIYGVIKGSAISHSGVGAGQYLPSIKVMEKTALKSINQASISAEDMTYIECHGTGTELGDPIELKALANAVSKLTDKKTYCALGSKANLGHMEAASGVCSLIKVLLSMKHKRLSPCANVTNVNSAIELDQTPFFLPKEPRKWQTNGHNKYVAGINSFGLGGSTGFMVVESLAMNEVGRNSSQSPVDLSVVICSAKDQLQADTYLRNLVAYMKRPECESMLGDEFANIAYTTQLGRIHYNHRIAIVASGREDFISKAEQYLDSRSSDSNRSASTEAVFVGNIKSSTDTVNLLSGDEGHAFINSLVASKKWEKIALLWTKGADIDWSVLNQGVARRRMPLPTYPFAKRECHINGYLKRKGISEATNQPLVSPVASSPEPKQVNDEQTVIKGQWYRADTKSIDFDVLIYDNSKSEIKNVGDTNLKKYWLNYLGDEANQGALLSGGNQPVVDAGADTSTPENRLSCTLPAELTEALQGFTQIQEIEVETLMGGVWAVLISRYTKLKHAQFGMIRSLSKLLDVEAHHSTDQGSRRATGDRYVLPLKVKTAVRGSISKWLGELQSNMVKKPVYKHVSLQAIGECVGIEAPFESVIIFTDNQTDTDYNFADDVKLVHFSVPLTVHVHIGASAVDLAIYYKTERFGEDKIKTMLDHFITLLEGVIQHPERNPAALSLQTKEEYRERFWKTLEVDRSR